MDKSVHRHLILLIPALGACAMLSKYPQDNIIEEVAEAAIQYETGVSIDLSPATPER